MRHLLLAQPPEPTAASQPDRHPAQHDESLGIALSSVFCVAIAYLIIASLQNCLGRRNPNHQRQSPPDDRHHNPEQNADWLMRQLEAIAVIVYGSSSSHSSVEICPICLVEYEEGEKVRAMPLCNHIFHKECIDQWLVTRSSFCPICRQRVIERAVEPARANCTGNNNNNNNGEEVRLDVVGMSSTQHLIN